MQVGLLLGPGALEGYEMIIRFTVYCMGPVCIIRYIESNTCSKTSKGSLHLGQTLRFRITADRYSSGPTTAIAHIYIYICVYIHMHIHIYICKFLHSQVKYNYEGQVQICVYAYDHVQVGARKVEAPVKGC